MSPTPSPTPSHTPPSVASPDAVAPGSPASWCEISASAPRHTIAALKTLLLTNQKLGIVVKADAYGHGLVPVARVLADSKVDWLITNCAWEALALRRAGISLPIYVCGHVAGFEAQALVEARARCVLYDADDAAALDAASRAAGIVTPVHLKVETGTHRQGLELNDALELGRRVRALPGLTLEGLTTHFADIEDTTDHRFAERQQARLDEAIIAFAGAGMPVPMGHAANSAATLIDPMTHGHLVRVGIAAYGLWPSKETRASFAERRVHRTMPATPHMTLQAVLSWRARLAQVKDVAAGAYVGYGRTFRTTHPTRIAVIPVGYHEGYDRRLSNAAHVLIDGIRCPVRGRVCMNMIMVDVTDVPAARAGAVATLLGEDGEERVSAEQLAGWMGTIHYEVVSRIHPSQPRIVV